MQGKIVKGIAGFYYVYLEDKGLYECKAKGVFRNKNIKPLVGDWVDIEIIDEENKKGNVNEILPRNNQLFRPAVANIDQALVVFATVEPHPDFQLMDKFLLLMKKENVPAAICFNKVDIATDEEVRKLYDTYTKSGYETFLTSAYINQGIEAIREYLVGKTTTFAGPSGVGKSSLLNLLQNNIIMQTGEISEKIKRGKHTTRHSELIHIDRNSFVMDTPGFSSIELRDVKFDDLQDYFIEFEQYISFCRFNGCAHINEPDCAVKQAVQAGNISASRYESYKLLYNEIKAQRRW